MRAVRAVRAVSGAMCARCCARDAVSAAWCTRRGECGVRPSAGRAVSEAVACRAAVLPLPSVRGGADALASPRPSRTAHQRHWHSVRLPPSTPLPTSGASHTCLPPSPPGQGEYKDGDPHGNAVFLEADGRAFEEVWANGRRKSRKLVTQIEYTNGKPTGVDSGAKESADSAAMMAGASGGGAAAAAAPPPPAATTPASSLAQEGDLIIDFGDDDPPPAMSTATVGDATGAATVVGGDDLVLIN